MKTLGERREIMFDFGLRLRELRNQRGYSQEALGKKINKSKSVVSSYENNLKTPPLDVLLSFAAIFNVSLDYLVGIEKSEMVSIEALGPRQRELIRSIVTELKHKSTPARGGLSPRQSEILSGLMQEFSKK